MKFLLTFLLYLSPLILFAQSPEALLEQAKDLSGGGDYSASTQKYKAASQQFEKSQNWLSYLTCGHGIGMNHLREGNRKEALKAFNQYIKVADEKSLAASEELAALHKGVGIVYFGQQDFVNALNPLKKALEIREKADPDNPDLARDYNNVAMILREQNQYKNAIEYLKNGLKKKPVAKIAGAMYTEVGMNYQFLGDYELALEYLAQASQICSEGFGPQHSRTARTHGATGQTLLAKKEYGKALKALKLALEIYNSVQDYDNIAITESNIARAFMAEWELDSALVYYQDALMISEQKLPVGNSREIDNNYNLGFLYTKMGRYSDAEIYLNKAFLLLNPQPADKSNALAQYYHALARFQKAQGNYKEAFAAAQQQLNSVIWDYENNDPYSLISEKEFETTLSIDLLTDALAVKARIFSEAYKNGKGGQKELETAYAHLDMFDKAFDFFRCDASSGDTKMAWSDLTLDAYENAIEICLDLAKLTGDNSYKEKALYYSEKSKSLVLLEAFQNSKANAMIGLPEEVLAEESELKLRITTLDQELFQLQAISNRTPEEETRKKAVEKELFDAKQAYQNFQEKLKNSYPDYFKMKYDIELLDLTGMRQLLGEDQAIVEYFVGDSSIFIFKITATEFEVQQIKLANNFNFLREIKFFRKSIYGQFLLTGERTDEKRIQYSEDYTAQAVKLYELLVKPIEPLPKRLLIIPAGVMGNMPFDPMITQKPADPMAYKSHDYFVRKYVVSYCYSGTLCKEMRDRIHKPTKGKLLAFAPTFGEQAASEVRGQRFALSPLAFNGREVDEVYGLVGEGTILKGAEATEAKFRELGADYQIVHFATHGMANDKYPDYSLLAFTEVVDDIENEFLYVGDLYNMQLNADLVVLSACETGLGEMQRGEGVVSLARAFSFAGAKSIFTTLWSVNDQSTSQIINAFYRNLAAGKNKDEAMQLAKLDYLERSNNAAAHPFLWSPYIFMGDSRPIEIGGGMPWWYFAVGGLVLALLLFGFSRMRGGKSAEA